MVGVVTTRHLFLHSRVILREFGAVCLFRCLWRTFTSDRNVTFLECIAPIRAAELARERIGSRLRFPE